MRNAEETVEAIREVMLNGNQEARTVLAEHSVDSYEYAEVVDAMLTRIAMLCWPLEGDE